MKRLLVLIPAALFAFPAGAQTAPEGAYRDLWCGIAFAAVDDSMPYTPEQVQAARDAGDTATEEQKQIVSEVDMVLQFAAGGATLVENATTAYKGAGFTDEAFGTIKTELEPKVATQINGASTEAEFSFEECVALIPTDAPAADAPSTEAPATETPAARAVQ